MTEQPTITQADREAAADIWAAYVAKIGECLVENSIRAGTSDESELVQTFARHRTTSLAAQDGLVEALRVAREYVQNVVDAEGKAFNVRDLVQIDAALSAIKEQHHD